MSEEPNSQLDAAVQAAQGEIKKIAAAQESRAAKQAFQQQLVRLLKPAVALLVVAGAIFWQGPQMQFWLLGPSASMVQNDLQLLLNQAAEEVDAYHEKHGKLPEKLTSPTLAKRVSYRIDGEHYILTASFGQATREHRY